MQPTLTANSTRLQLDRTSGAVTEGVNAAGIEQVDLNVSTSYGIGVTNLGGEDTFVVNDLSQTSVKVLNLGLGPDVGVESDQVTLNGRSTADTVSITGGSTINVAGLGYDINIIGAAANEDSLTFNGTALPPVVNSASLRP